MNDWNNGVILLVEDHPVSAELAVTFLRGEGFTDEVVVARDSLEDPSAS
jgi:CheY-like chemotaxis protein